MNRPTPYTPKVTLPSTNSLSLGTNDLSVTFHRTVRVPRSDNLVNALPASLGAFPLYKVSDFTGNVPKDWQAEGYFIPMYPHEAMWISFMPKNPVALLVGAGMVNAVTGEHLNQTLSTQPQNYVVCPPQPWLDGFKPTTGEKVFQFVAAKLGEGETAEEQILGTAEFGGIQFGLFHPIKPLVPFPRMHEQLIAGGFSEPILYRASGMQGMSVSSTTSYAVNAADVDARSMGLGAGGAIRQKIYSDPYLNGQNVSEVWQEKPVDLGYIYIVHSNDFKSITGHDAPSSPVTYKTYQEQGMPWFGLPDGEWIDVEGGQSINDLKPVSGGPSMTDTTPNPITKDLWK